MRSLHLHTVGPKFYCIINVLGEVGQGGGEGVAGIVKVSRDEHQGLRVLCLKLGHGAVHALT